MSPAPNVGEVPRKLARHDENGVDPHHVLVADKTRCKAFGGHSDSPKPIFVEREHRGIEVGSLLHLNERDRASAPRNQVHLTAGDTGSPGEDAPTAQP